jgi:hypothetical protein
MKCIGLKYNNHRVPFGCVPCPGLKGFPKGKIRLRIRNDDFVRIFIRNRSRFVATIPVIEGGFWHYCPDFNQGINIKS